jgi:hypothetical protein
MAELSRKPRITPEVFHRLSLQEKLSEVNSALSGVVGSEVKEDFVFVPLEGDNVAKLTLLRKYHGVSNDYEAVERAISEYITGSRRSLVSISIGPRGFRISPIRK